MAVFAVGIIPPELGNLLALDHLNLGDNNLIGIYVYSIRRPRDPSPRGSEPGLVVVARRVYSTLCSRNVTGLSCLVGTCRTFFLAFLRACSLTLGLGGRTCTFFLLSRRVRSMDASCFFAFRVAFVRNPISVCLATVEACRGRR